MRLVIIALLVGLTSLGVAQTTAEPSEVDELKTKAESTKDYDRGKIYSEIARELTEQANREYRDGAPDKALATLQEVLEYAEKASAAAKLKNKKTKATEINLRHTARRLEEIGRTLAVEEREPVQSVVDKVDAIHKALLEYFLKRG